jgi:Circularly permutated YpsA SLOG family
MSRLKIVSGGQSGVDRAALDVALELSLEYGGWCPKGGWAEDHVIEPGLLPLYPNLKATPLPDVQQRTEWNVRDSDATLILTRGSDLTNFTGTKLTVGIAEKLGRDHLLVNLQNPAGVEEAKTWLKEAGNKRTLNVAGPRESEVPGIYEEARIFLRQLLR